MVNSEWNKPFNHSAIQSVKGTNMSEAQSLDYNLINSSTKGQTDNIFDYVSMNPVSQELDGIEIIVSMAKTGKINPWSIDIVDITDKYLAQLFQMKAQNLRLTGRTLLFAAILLKLKSNILENIDIVAFEQNPEEVDDLDISDDFNADDYDDYIPSNVISIDEVLQRRTSVRLNRNRVVTLRDLIRQLEFYEMIDKKQSLKNAHERAKRRVQSFANLSADDIVNLAHDEYIEDSVQRLKANLEQILNREGRIELNELTLLGMDRISAYIALLFLSAESDYELVQDEFYAELYVTRGVQA